jgi:hypothetical protein
VSRSRSRWRSSTPSTIQLAPLDARLRAFARRQAGCKALLSQFGVGELTAVTILAELGDARRFSSSRDAVRFAGLDITVHQSDQRRASGHLSRQGPPAGSTANPTAAAGFVCIYPDVIIGATGISGDTGVNGDKKLGFELDWVATSANQQSSVRAELAYTAP